MIELPAGVGMTAVGVARVRAVESARPDRLFEDPLAAAIATVLGWQSEVPEGLSIARAEAAWLYAWVVVRTKFLDDAVGDALHAGCRQVVILGAGLDGRAFRLSFPEGARLFEVDVDDVLDFKDAVLAEAALAARCERVTVRADLRDDWPAALLCAGFGRDQPTLWLAEGLLVYLTDDDNDLLLTRVRELSAPGSRLGVTLAGSRRHGRRSAAFKAVTQMWKSGPRKDPKAWLAGHGWNAEVYSAGERLTAYGRPGSADNSTPRLAQGVLAEPR